MFRKAYVNNPRVYNEIHQFTLFCNQIKNHYYEDADILVFKDFYCANGRHSGAYDFTEYWICYVYQNLPEDLKEKYYKDCERKLPQRLTSSLTRTRDLISKMESDDKMESAVDEAENVR